MKLSNVSFLVLAILDQYFVLSEKYSTYEESYLSKRSFYDLIPWHVEGGAGPVNFMQRRKTGEIAEYWGTAGNNRRNQMRRIIKVLFNRLVKQYVRIV